MSFKPVFIEGRDINDTWFQFLQAAYDKGRPYVKSSGSRTGMKVYGFDYVSGFIHYPHTRPLAPIMPEGIPPVTTDEKIEEYFANYLMDSSLSKNEHYKYSTWIVGGDGKNANVSCYINQVDWVINHFKTKGYLDLSKWFDFIEWFFDVQYKREHSTNENTRYKLRILQGK